jgi:D-alanyl-D-alanine carboxypeptidase/D-alanyl-D-alanine-endopeptidase (penicillin-binding protein 4)
MYISSAIVVSSLVLFTSIANAQVVVDVLPFTTVVDVIPTTTQMVPSSDAVVNVVPVSVQQQAQAASGTAICPAELTTTLNRIVTRTGGIRWGVQVQTQGTPGNRFNLYGWNPRSSLTPASNNKIFTTTAALQRLGPQFRMRTVVTGNSSGPNLATLRIIGQGDPSLKTSHMAVLAQRLNQRGIRQINLLIGDDTYFRGAAINPNWDADDTLAGFGAPVNSLMINQNGIGVTLFPQQIGQRLRVQWDDPSDAQDYRLNNRSVTVPTSQGESIDVYRQPNTRTINIDGQLRVGSASEPAAASISNPGNYLVQKFRNALTTAQITVNQGTLVRSTPAPPGEIELAALESPPLSVLLNETNQESNNIYAEALLKTIGKAQSPDNNDATTAGITGVKTILTSLGVDPNQYTMADGSGLARNNRATAESFVQTLQAMAGISESKVYRASLPIAGTSGTLRSRFRNTPAQGRVQAKTGTISGVVSLSGYASPPNYSPLVFSILANSSSVSSATMRNAMDEMVLALMRLRRC